MILRRLRQTRVVRTRIKIIRRYMRTRVLNHFSNAMQSSREQNASLVHVELALRVSLTKEMSGRSLRDRSAQAQVQEGIKRRSSGSRCALCASSVRHTDRTIASVSIHTLPWYPLFLSRDIYFPLHS